MEIKFIAVALAISLGVGWFQQVRGWVLLLASLLGIILFAPASPIHHWQWIVPFLTLISVAGVWLSLQFRESPAKSYFLAILTLSLIGLLIGLKTPFMAELMSQWLRAQTGLPIFAARPSDLAWIGWAYITLRLLTLLIEARAQRLPRFTLTEVVIYTCNPLTLLAGPLDRPERFISDLRKGQSLTPERFERGAKRLLMGLTKKFLLADSLAFFVLSPQLAQDVRGSLEAWLILYAYSLYLFWDFSGYSDMVIGLGIWAGFDLPENFNAPYFRPTLALFWQNWHMTLTEWFRTYVFLPTSRWLLRHKISFGAYFLAQLVTMMGIAAWHGVTAHFLVWGMWHAVGLFLSWTILRLARPIYSRFFEGNFYLRNLIYGMGVFLTFHYVALGWVWFALPDVSLGWQFFQKLWGL